MPIGDNERWKRLAALGAKSEIPTPDGEAKMSAVILQLAEPLMKQHAKTAKRAQAIIVLTIAGWNKSMFPPDKQPLVEKDLIDAFVPKDGSAEAVGVAVDLMDFIADRRQKLFPDLRNIIVDYEVEMGDGRLTLNVTSAPIPDLCRDQTKGGMPMSLSDGARHNEASTYVTDRAEIISRYKQLRAVGQKLNNMSLDHTWSGRTIATCRSKYG